jgi:hypothetical protein
MRTYGTHVAYDAMRASRSTREAYLKEDQLRIRHAPKPYMRVIGFFGVAVGL